MPLPLPVLPMSSDEFHVMRHQLGWQHEYWEGMARLSPCEVAVIDLILPLSDSRNVAVEIDRDAGVAYRKVTAADIEQLESLHHAAFERETEYAGYPDDAYQRSIHQSIAAFFGRNDRRSRGTLDHSYVAVCDGEIIAALLVRHAPEGFVIEPIMVALDRRRCGIGRHLLQLAADSLRLAGATTLYSRCHLGNATSRQWHRANGFDERLNFFAAGHLATHHEWMSRHYESLGRMEAAATEKQFAELYDQLRLALKDLAFRRYLALPEP